MEPLLVRFTKAQRAWVRKRAKSGKCSEAQVIRLGVEELKYWESKK